MIEGSEFVVVYLLPPAMRENFSFRAKYFWQSTFSEKLSVSMKSYSAGANPDSRCIQVTEKSVTPVDGK